MKDDRHRASALGRIICVDLSCRYSLKHRVRPHSVVLHEGRYIGSLGRSPSARLPNFRKATCASSWLLQPRRETPSPEDSIVDAATRLSQGRDFHQRPTLWNLKIEASRYAIGTEPCGYCNEIFSNSPHRQARVRRRRSGCCSGPRDLTPGTSRSAASRSPVARPTRPGRLSSWCASHSTGSRSEPQGAGRAGPRVSG